MKDANVQKSGEGILGMEDRIFLGIKRKYSLSSDKITLAGGVD